MEEYTLLFELPDLPNYVHGFEAGMLWVKIKEGEIFESHPIHTDNVSVIKRMCDTFLCDYEIVEGDETWSYLTINPTVITHKTPQP